MTRRQDLTATAFAALRNTLTEEALVILDVQVVVSTADEWLDDD